MKKQDILDLLAISENKNKELKKINKELREKNILLKRDLATIKRELT